MFLAPLRLLDDDADTSKPPPVPVDRLVFYYLFCRVAKIEPDLSLRPKYPSRHLWS